MTHKQPPTTGEAITSMKMFPKNYLFAIFIIILGATHSECCTFPTDLQDGTWHSMDMGNVTFNSTHFTASSIFNFPALTFACMSNSGDRYYSLSATFSYLSNDFKVAMCFNLYKSTTTSYSYFLLTDILPNTNISRFVFQSATYSFSESNTCTLSTEDPSQLRMLVKEGFINESTSYCGNNILGNYVYSLNGSTCNETSLVTCGDQKTLTFNYTTCTDKMYFSADGVLGCVYYLTSNNVEYTILYNQDSSVDDSTYYRFTCVAATVSGGTTYVSSYPEACLANQTSTYTYNPGQVFTLIANTTCPYSSSSDDSDDVLSAGGAIAVALAMLAIIGAIVIIGVWYYFKVAKKKKVQPDPGFIPSKTPPVDTKEQRALDGRVSPFSPYPTVSELAVYRFGPSPADGIDDDDGGLTLEATTPGFTEGRRTIFDKDAERESQASLPMYSEVGGETPEPTRLSEVNTRMSEVSEANIADPTPWTMTRATMNIPEETSVSPLQPEGPGKVQSPREANDVTL